MNEMIPQHKHCVNCGRAFTGGGLYCSDACKEDSGKEVKGKLLKLGAIWLAIVAATIILVLLVRR
jgi:predicted nucleic acid-binding Zn ribbon protein